MINSIHEVTPDDIKPLANLFDLYRQFYGQTSNVEAAGRFLDERMRKKESAIFISRQDQQYTGFAQCYPLFTSVGMRRLWLLNDLFVKKEFRGQGISKLLINRCKDLVKETDAAGLMLETEKTNVVGNALYPKEGFVQLTGSNFYQWNR